MPKVKISEFDIDPANNTDINSINIAEGCAPSGINNAIRQLMSDLKEFQTGAGGDSMTAVGLFSDTVGEKTAAAGVTVDGVLLKDGIVTAPINGTVGATTANTGAFTTLSASGVATFTAGTVSAPAITTTGDTNTGIFFPAADTIAFTEGGTESMRIDSSGRVGIGISSPSAILSCYATGGSTVAGLFRTDQTDAYISFRASGTASDFSCRMGVIGENLVFLNNGANERMRIDSSGNVGIGTSSPTAGGKLDVNGIAYFGTGDKVRIYSNNVLQGAGTLDIGTIGSAALIFNTANTERMRIDSSGNLLVGTTSLSAGSEKFRIQSAGATSATAGIQIVNSSGTELFFIRSDGAFRTGSASVSPYNNTLAASANCYINTDGTLLRATSSLKYKKDVQDATFGLVDALKLRPVTYKGKNEVDGDKVYGGLIAEEVHEAGLTQFVQYAEDGTPDALHYGNMVSLCIKAIQEQQAIITDLKARIETLESK
jgi:hypothetical protein